MFKRNVRSKKQQRGLQNDEKGKALFAFFFLLLLFGYLWQECEAKIRNSNQSFTKVISIAIIVTRMKENFFTISCLLILTFINVQSIHIHRNLYHKICRFTATTAAAIFIHPDLSLAGIIFLLRSVNRICHERSIDYD
jgi:hypothetical protein